MLSSQVNDYIAVLDCGGQTAHLICRRLRDQGLSARIINIGEEHQLASDAALRGVIVSGSPSSVAASDFAVAETLLELKVPLLGICYGFHWLCQALGGEVQRLAQAEYGPQLVNKTASGVEHPLLSGIAAQFTSWMSHGDSLATLPPDFDELARSVCNIPAVIAHKQRLLYGVQYHPEISHCEGGGELLSNFAQQLCRMPKNWSLEEQLQEMKEFWQQRLATQQVVLLISGGVDSAVVAAFLIDILPPEQLHLLYFDTGLMRLNEGDQVMNSLEQLGAQNIERLNVGKQFLEALAAVEEPEEKRRIIGNLFIEIQEDHLAGRYGNDYLLAQGTLYTDLIESGAASKHSQNIKSHHNVASPLVAQLRKEQRLVEPLSQLYKDEVRRLGCLLGLSEELVKRHPFPGPGLAIRILGAVDAQKVELLQRVDAIFISELRRLKLYDRIWQAFAVLLPLKSVGVTGDKRHYGSTVALRAVCAEDGMSASAYAFSAEQLQEIVSAICGQVPEIARVVYDITAKPPATIEWE